MSKTPRKYTGNFERDFDEDAPLIPELVLESVVSLYADDDGQHADLNLFLIEKFKYLYENNASFGKKFRLQGIRERELMKSFARHWSESWIKKNYPKQYRARVKTYESNIFEFTRRR